MKSNTFHADPAQLGFDAFLNEAETINKAAVFEKEHGHLPGAMEEALPFYRDLIDQHHAATLIADLDTVMTLRKEASRLALKLNKGEPGILAGPEAPGCVLAALTAADAGAVPKWGQVGSFIIEVKSVRVRIEIDGLFGIGACHMPWLNFSAHAVDWDRPFISETGYRCFMGLHAQLVSGLTPETFAHAAITAHIEKSIKRRLIAIKGRSSI